nr:transposase [Saccharopolyspora spinosa]
MVRNLVDAGGVLVAETGLLKKGTKSARVQRQYSGPAGRVVNCQLRVVFGYTAKETRTLIEREPYSPKSWIADPGRCREARMPDETEFATKPVLARAMVARRWDTRVPARWLTADESHGQDSLFRTWLVGLCVCP